MFDPWVRNLIAAYILLAVIDERAHAEALLCHPANAPPARELSRRAQESRRRVIRARTRRIAETHDRNE
ncbi:MAG TPA: hypothetical protein VFN46_03910 [Acetobacteraceae bacterium]|nr:hypothetical protein [Acetobacteraceae bacterium]